ncbi:MAG: heterodisulfide reductase-related iron-sulfur binding cluster [Candidatus Methanoperedens sp.]|nr:heterodisulfide reductase-related iron-sulfur binding cluster [Candidatus Methanoperedens sp.]
MKEYASFLGCIIPNRYPGIEASSTRILGHFDVELVQINGASCCPAPGVFSSFHLDSWLAIAARNIALGEMTGKDIITMCNGCYGSLTEASFLLACTHYGCHFLKPAEMKKHGSSERPRLLDEIVEASGARSVDYKDKTMCCGFGGGVRARNLDVTLDFTREKLNNIISARGDCIVDQCASCHLEFDRGQVEIKKIFGQEFRVPVLYFTQLIGLGLGMGQHELGLDFHSIPAKPLLDKLNGGRR